MIINFIYLILFFCLALFINLLILKIFHKRFFFVEIFIFLLIFVFYILRPNSTEIIESMYYLILYGALFFVYAFTIIMPLEGSPSLKIIELIYKNKKISKKKLLKKFLQKSFIQDRLDKLISAGYIVSNRNFFSVKKKSIFIKASLVIDKLQSKNRNLNG